jgi:hypothetical protein
MNSPNVSEMQPTEESHEGGTATLSDAKQKMKSAARETVAEIKNAANSTVTRAKEEAGKIASEKRSHAADRIGSYGSAIHDSAKSLEEKDPNIAWLTHRAADRLERVADYVRNRDTHQLRVDVENIARRHPAAFFGGLFVAGLALGNLLKASNRGGPPSTGASHENGATSGNHVPDMGRRAEDFS